MERRKLPLKEEAKYSGRGVHYCELCDGHMYQDKVISVMGGGNAAVDAANFLTKYAKELYLIHRSKLRADKASQDKLLPIRRSKCCSRQRSALCTVRTI